MAIAVGETKADAAASYVSVTGGTLARLGAASIAASASMPSSPTTRPAESTAGPCRPSRFWMATGKVVVTQRVYPNKKLHSGSLSINAPGCRARRLWFARVDASGTETGADRPARRLLPDGHGRDRAARALAQRDACRQRDATLYGHGAARRRGRAATASGFPQKPHGARARDSATDGQAAARPSRAARAKTSRCRAAAPSGCSASAGTRGCRSSTTRRSRSSMRR